MSSLEEVNLCEGEGQMDRNLGVERRQAWEENTSLEANSYGYSTIESNDTVSLQEGLETGGESWGRGQSNRSMEDMVQELKEKLCAKDVELQKYKHQLENCHAPQSPDSLMSELESTRSQLASAKEKIDELQEELEQEVLMGGMLRHENNTSNTSGETGNDLQEMRAELGNTKGELADVHKDSERLRRELQSASAEAENARCELKKAREEVAQTRRELALKERELEKTRQGLCNTHSVDSNKFEVVNDELQRKLDKAREELLCKERELEETKRELESTKHELESEKKITPRRGRLDTENRLKDKLRQKHQECETLNSKLKWMEEEKSRVEQDLKTKKEELIEVENEMRMANEGLQKIRGENEAEIRRRIELEDELTSSTRHFENERKELGARMSQLQRNLQSRQEREEALEQVVASEKQAKVGTQMQLRIMQEQNEELAKENEKVLEEKEMLKEENEHHQAKIHNIEKDRKSLHTRALDAEEACGGFKEEVEKTMEDYERLASELKKVTEEKETLRKKHGHTMNQLSVRTEEVKNRDKELQKKVVERADLEGKLQTLQGTMLAMEQQNNIFEDDFREERKAREKAVSKIGELHKRIDSLEKDKKDLREQLNRQAASHLAHYAEDNYSAMPIPRDPPRPH